MLKQNETLKIFSFMSQILVPIPVLNTTTQNVLQLKKLTIGQKTHKTTVAAMKTQPTIKEVISNNGQVNTVMAIKEINNVTAISQITIMTAIHIAVATSQTNIAATTNQISITQMISGLVAGSKNNLVDETKDNTMVINKTSMITIKNIHLNGKQFLN